MINITRKEDCCGCGACFDACSMKAIVWEADCDGFSYPRVDTSKCVDCGLCNKVCPIENSESINHHNDGFTPIVLGAYHKDENIRFTSTSGGAFWGLAEEWVNRGGYVAGAVFHDHFKVKHIVTNDIQELQRIKGSKYCQSDCRGMYREIAKLLRSGEKVMATGLPCQMAGLRQYLRKDFENLLVVDLICHSVPSPLLFEKYIDYLEKKYKSPVIKYHPKNKELGGWHHFSFKAYFQNGKIYHQNSDLYTHVAFDSIMARYSCFECHYKNIPQPSDITIGDFWGIENVDASYDSPNGVSKIMANSKKGLEYINSLSCFDMREYAIKEGVLDNKRAWPQLRPAKRCNEKLRERFVCNLHSKSFQYTVNDYLLPETSLLRRIYKCIKNHIIDAIK